MRLSLFNLRCKPSTYVKCLRDHVALLETIGKVKAANLNLNTAFFNFDADRVTSHIPMYNKIIMQFSQRLCNLLNYYPCLLLTERALTGSLGEVSQRLLRVLCYEVYVAIVFEIVDEAEI